MEQTPSLVQALAELGAERKAARFRAALPEIEAAIQRGATHASILNTLAAAGLQMNLNEFRVALHRSRKAIKKGKPHAPTFAPPLPPTPSTDGPKRFNFNDHTHTRKREKW
ncbi:hypothetical protein HA052_23180 [Chromobacterium haemolyticum]|uniref:KfrA N-terminal DNA-binding domain-containing protein n=1 Tax=Chromobacterium fluminis TaxID=3044269 RepID=A0ABX0LFV1_9NEIS|nr:hypothetical protein [Chromobacterium haemolyticum]NHR08098.1 hypothetical protein [Chromobacterium haemolyticum]